jgi:L-amino acid N-acyltransferase YncA
MEISPSPTILIRPATAEDAEAVRAIYAPAVRGSFISFELEPPGAAEMRRRIADTLAKGYPWLVYEADGEVLGYAYATEHRARAAYRWSAECSVYVREGEQGRGIGRALYRSLFAVLALQRFRNVIAGIALPNAASVALHRALGFRDVGVFHRVGYKGGAWRDVLWCELPLPGDDDAPPPEPLTIAQVQAMPGWAAALNAGLAENRPRATHPHPDAR